MSIATRPAANAHLLPIDRFDVGLALYLPLWYPHGDMTGSTIYSYDTYRRTGTVTEATYGLQGRTFDGTNDKIVITGTVTGVQTVIVWVKPSDNTTRSIMDFDTGTHSIEMDGSGDLTATGWGTPSFYVDGVSATAITANAWNCAVVTTATAFNGTAVVLGNEDSFFIGDMGDVLMYDRVLALGEIVNIYESTKWRYK